MNPETIKALAYEAAAEEIDEVYQERRVAFGRRGDSWSEGYLDGLERAEMILRRRVAELLGTS